MKNKFLKAVVLALVVSGLCLGSLQANSVPFGDTGTNGLVNIGESVGETSSCNTTIVNSFVIAEPANTRQGVFKTVKTVKKAVVQEEEEIEIVSNDPGFPSIFIAVYPNHMPYGHKRQSLASRGKRGFVRLDIAPIIKKYAAINNIDPRLVRAVIKVESGNWNYARSYSGALGLMQMIPSTASYMGCNDPWNPESNIKAGCKYLRMMINMFGNIDRALAAYNAGPGTVRSYGITAGAAHYVRKVRQYYPY
ncbi:MAG: lytic transglycosylase domain-containing protein [Chloroflexi bacterium]|nr:lytic transglycosylase domain-containing protein [Chloroflexota bacterium]